MKHFKKIVIPLFTACALFTLILDAQTAITGATEGVQLCIKTLIPSLFPFFVISGYFCSVYSQVHLSIFNPILRLCGMPKGSESLLVIGILGGYPVGAKAIADAYKNGWIQKDTAKRMLGFCSNAGPAFVFGVVGVQFSKWYVPWVLLFILILSAILSGCLLPCKNSTESMNATPQQPRFTESFEGSLRAISTVCGWVILFRVFLAILERWFIWLLPDTVQIVITGIIELSNGCAALSRINNDGLRFVVSAGILSFGGLCVHLQTISVTGDLETGIYFPGKNLQCMISLALSCIAQHFLFNAENRLEISSAIIPFLFLSLILTTIILSYAKKTVAIPGRLLYNTGN